MMCGNATRCAIRGFDCFLRDGSAQALSGTFNSELVLFRFFIRGGSLGHRYFLRRARSTLEPLYLPVTQLKLFGRRFWYPILFSCSAGAGLINVVQPLVKALASAFSLTLSPNLDLPFVVSRFPRRGLVSSCCQPRRILLVPAQIGR